MSVFIYANKPRKQYFALKMYTFSHSPYPLFPSFELGGEHITVFASGGPKNYGYKTNTGKTEVKVRGITLDCTAQRKVNFESMCELVSLRAECGVTGTVTVDIPFRITRNTRTKEIQTKRMKKDYRVVYNKRVIVDDYKTLPYGY